MNYLVWSVVNNAWWRGGRAGYTHRLEAAGRYSRDEAISICALSRDGWGGLDIPSEIPIAEADAKACAEKFNAALPVA